MHRDPAFYGAMAVSFLLFSGLAVSIGAVEYGVLWFVCFVVCLYVGLRLREQGR